jgi:Tfp pilus assembly protein PilN
LTTLQARRLAVLEREKVLSQVRQGLFRPGEGHSDRLLLVTRTIPADTWIAGLKADGAMFEIAGFTLDPASLNDWVAQLGRHAVMRGLTLSAVKVDLVAPDVPAVRVAGAAPVARGKPLWSFSLVSAQALSGPQPVAVPGAKP